ncbi:MAG: hypothetical protein IJ678_04920 [Kiritimatiellae bacterium]|nr:hypothetical protein [Kiritimatiellia bacterium]
MEGRGERVRRIVPPGEHPAPMWLVAVFPDYRVSTPEAYAAWDAAAASGAASRPASLDTRTGLWEDCARSVRDGDVRACAASLSNDLQNVVSKLHPPTERFCLALRRGGALKSILTGSGSAVFGLAQSREAAEAAKRSLGGEIRSKVLATLPDGVMAAHGPLVP